MTLAEPGGGPTGPGTAAARQARSSMALVTETTQQLALFHLHPQKGVYLTYFPTIWDALNAMNLHPDKLLSEKDWQTMNIARLATLRKWRLTGKGPRFMRLGRLV
jgi:hypothetical protein